MNLYAGAGSKLELERIARLGRGWVVQPKVDGMYVELWTDSHGAVAQVYSRSGKPVADRVHQLDGAVIGAPDSVYIGELEAHTERGRLAAERHGRPHVHLFDCRVSRRIELSDRPYGHRRMQMVRERMDLEESSQRSWRWSCGRRRGQDGRYADASYPGWVYAPIVEQWPAARAEWLWGSVVCDSHGEGIVAVSLDAPMGKRGAKRKCKPTDTLDVGIVTVDGARAVYRLDDGRIGVVGVGRRCVRKGELWELRHEGYFSDGTPRFPVLVRRRDDVVSLAAWRQG